jgi:hypothetical protein
MSASYSNNTNRSITKGRSTPALSGSASAGATDGAEEQATADPEKVRESISGSLARESSADAARRMAIEDRKNGHQTDGRGVSFNPSSH